jgi:hypothetical protein
MLQSSHGLQGAELGTQLPDAHIIGTIDGPLLHLDEGHGTKFPVVLATFTSVVLLDLLQY